MRKIIPVSVLAFVSLFVIYELGLVFPPVPLKGAPVVIRRGVNAQEIADSLKTKQVIRSKILFVWAAYVTGIHDNLQAGSFHFERPVSVFGAISFLEQSRPEKEILIQEGSTVKDIAKLLAENGIVGERDFIDAASSASDYDFPFLAEVPEGYGLEGYLFPDTYRFFEDATPGEIIRTMLDNFSKKIGGFGDDIKKSGLSTYEAITLASIIEKEVHSSEDMALVSSVLWNRLKIGMALQTDATLYYLTGRASNQLTKDDLELDSPYNTYKYAGLPAGPISNPGSAAIKAAIDPADSGYLYYLSDKNGVTYYSKTFEKHKQNKFKYLR